MISAGVSKNIAIKAPAVWANVTLPRVPFLHDALLVMVDLRRGYLFNILRWRTFMCVYLCRKRWVCRKEVCNGSNEVLTQPITLFLPFIKINLTQHDESAAVLLSLSSTVSR